MAKKLYSGMSCKEIQDYCRQLLELRKGEFEDCDNDSIYVLAMLIANLAARIKENA